MLLKSGFLFALILTNKTVVNQRCLESIDLKIKVPKGHKNLFVNYDAKNFIPAQEDRNKLM